jgi:hypothetical protein
MLTIDELLTKVPPAVLERYDFSRAAYHGALKPVTGIRCPAHGEFRQYPAQLRRGASLCPACGDAVRRAKQRLTQEDFLAAAREAHGDRFAYDRAVYATHATKVVVTCREHGDFTILPGNHLHKRQGCPTCATFTRGRRHAVLDAAARTAATKIASAAAAFEADARAVHGDAYDYATVEYRNARERVTIICPQHGPFEQTPMHHLRRGHGCPRCSHHLSRAEDEIARFVRIFAPVVQRDRSVVAPKELDVYVPSRRLAIEYCGMFWHSHGSVDEERAGRRRHAEKHRACESAGIRLLTVWETDWTLRRRQMLRLIRNALGASRGRLMARKCDLAPVPLHEAARFFDAWHPQGGAGYGRHWGLYWKGKLVACMRFTLGANDRGTTGGPREWTLARYATRVTVAGGAGRLFRAFLDEVRPSLVKSFSDNRLFAGGMYLRLGFRLEAEIDPDYAVWSPKTGLRPKSHYQRRAIPARLREHGSEDVFAPAYDPRSEAEMTYCMGARRIYDCGKRRWVWSAA